MGEGGPAGGTSTGYDGQLVAAVRAGTADEVRALLDRGADPDAGDAGGLPVLCVAVAGYDAPVAEALVEGGADHSSSPPGRPKKRTARS
ncbi:ankyrin repeat domain-containing protein [Streptomyces sp. SA15]|uniref:ankyrin repeat domain-containing protein n=1 Tax=Streptomyces sp. SA15 TaxID=934019 RepID=UPI00211CFE85|nr:ankyrin repeat domain-containing protein [Streptomyces sp. SA15]